MIRYNPTYKSDMIVSDTGRYVLYRDIKDLVKKAQEFERKLEEVKLTGLEEKILNYISNRINDNQKPPTLKEISDNCGLSSCGTTHRYLQSLENKGRIVRGKGHRQIVVWGV